MPPATAWHRLTGKQTLARVDSDLERGHSESEALQRLARHGRNDIPRGKRRTFWLMFLAEFGELLIIVLLAAAAISALLGEVRDSILILVIVVLKAIIGATQSPCPNERPLLVRVW